MICLAIMPYRDISAEQVMRCLSEEERIRLCGKNEKYTVSSGLCRLLLFALCDKVLGEKNYSKRIAYRTHTALSHASGAPYLEGREDVSISLSHTEGLVVALLSNEGDVGVDVELISRINEMSDDAISRIQKRASLNAFSNNTTEKASDMQIIIYLFDGKEVKEVECDASFNTKPQSVFSSSILEFASSYTRMEAVMKGTGLGFCALGEKEKHIRNYDVITRFFGDYVISVATQKKLF